jgi:hypothetical protein
VSVDCILNDPPYLVGYYDLTRRRSPPRLAIVEEMSGALS